MSDAIRVGVIGAGANTKLRHIPGLQAIDGVSVDVVCNRSEESSLKVAKEFGIPRIAKDWHEVVSDDELDAVCIGTWPYMHAETTIAALEYGKHVLTEARMSRNLKEALAMQAAAQAKPDLVCQIVPSPFTLDMDDTIIGLVKDGTLGEIREARMTHTAGQLASADTPLTWRLDFDLSGYNVLTLGIFYEALQRWITGDPEWIVASAGTYVKERTHWETGERVEVKIPDSISVVGGYASGTRLIAHFSGVESGPPQMGFQLNGSKGSLKVDLMTRKLLLAGAGQTAETEAPFTALENSGWNVEAEFIASIREGTPVAHTSFEQGVRYMRVTEAIYRSHTNDAARVALGELG